MNQSSPEQNGSAAEQPRSGPGLAWLIVTWGRLLVGLALAGEGGVLYAQARTDPSGPSLWVGVIAVALGAVLSLSGLYSIYSRTRPQDVIIPDDIPSRPEPAMPMLGALLVYKYQVISEEQLERALEQQRREGRNKRRIGEILLDMGLISGADLQAALDYQRSRARSKQLSLSER
jgi:hypothetical protein